MSVSPVTVDVRLAPEEMRSALARDARAGLLSTPRSIPPVWFYDERGSRLFDEITRLPEYYLTRTERGMLREHSRDIASASRASTLVDLGSGTSEKTRILLDALSTAGTLRRFVPLDVSAETLRAGARTIGAAYPGVEITAIVGDFRDHLDGVPAGGHRLIAFLGSTIGNFTPAERGHLLRAMRTAMTHEDRLLLGTDLVKDPARLVAAYDDARGVTAEFNRNVLRVLNRELAADFDVDAFQHVAVWNATERWIEMRLRSARAQHVSVPGLELEIDLAGGEEILTEICAKFTPEGVAEELARAGLASTTSWTDPAGDYLVTLAAPLIA